MQGFNMGRYVPPDLEGVASGNQIHQKHALGNRARNLHKSGELTVRFEMPFNAWCLHCDPAGETVLIGQGVRFNALKRKVGMYYTTPVWAFRMRHSVCGGWIEIKTDPRNTEYVVTEGARRQEKGLERGTYEEDGVEEIRVKLPGEKVEERDAFEKVEGKVGDKKKALTQQERMVELLKLSKRDWEDPYEKSRKLRRTFRVERKRLEAVDADNEAIKDRMGLGIELLEESEGDRVRAGMVQFQPGRGLGEIDPTKKPLFIEDKNDASGTSAGSGNKKRKLGAKELAAQRKTDLQKELKGNTRALLDPFLVDNSWEPAGRERKRNGRSSRVTASSSSISAPGSGYAPTSHSQSTSGDNGHDVGADTENAQPNALGTPDEDEIDNDTAGPGPPSHGDEKKQSQSRPALVDYGSDSD